MCGHRTFDQSTSPILFNRLQYVVKLKTATNTICWAAILLVGLVTLTTAHKHELAVDQLNDLSDEARKIRNEAIKIGSADIALLPLGMGRYPDIIDGLEALSDNLHGAGGTLNGQELALCGWSSGIVAGAFLAFVDNQEDMLDVLIEKAGLAEILPVAGQPVVEALQRLGFALDDYGSAVQDISNDRSTVTIESGRKLLANKVDQCVGSYSGIVD